MGTVVIRARSGGRIGGEKTESCLSSEMKVHLVLLWGKGQCSCTEFGQLVGAGTLSRPGDQAAGQSEAQKTPCTDTQTGVRGSRGGHSGTVWPSCPQGGQGFLPPEPPFWWWGWWPLRPRATIFPSFPQGKPFPLDMSRLPRTLLPAGPTFRAMNVGWRGGD